MNRVLSIAIVFWALCCSAGCAVRMPPAQSTTATAPDTDAGHSAVFRHPFPPVELIVHPLTRITTNPETGDPQIEAHFELVDRYGHTVKSLGTAAIELRVDAPGTSGASGGPRQVSRWTTDLSTPDLSARPFDRVTRTYRLTLVDLPRPLPDPQTLTLGIRFTTDAGIRLSAERRLGSIR